MRKIQKVTACLLTFCLLLSMASVAFAADTSTYEDAHTIVLSSTQDSDGGYTNTATYDNEDVKEYDYIWGIDMTEEHSDVKNSPAEYYSGDEPTGEESVYIAHDIYYYPELDESQFVKQDYDGEQEWCFYYTLSGYEDFIFSTLPVTGNSVPTDMMHSAEDAYENSVLHITQAGTYILEGEWHGQINIDLGDDAFSDDSCKVTLILNGVDVTCSVAAAVVFKNVYEVDNTWEAQSSWSYDVDTTNAGANVIIADGTENNFSGTNIYRILKTKYKSDSTTVQKKSIKIDGAFYSYMSMNIDCESQETGVMNVESTYEGLDSELHLTINGGNVNINSGNDGINVNEDYVSVFAMNDGNLHIEAGNSDEGDGIDSNGYLLINGGTVVSSANPSSDCGLDSDSGTYINGGYVFATGSGMDSVQSGSAQILMNLNYSSALSNKSAVLVTDTDGNVVFAYDPNEDSSVTLSNRSSTNVVISCPGFEQNGTYYLYAGGTIYGTDTNGMYDVSTVTGYADMYQQCYGSNGGSTGPGGDSSGPGGDSSGPGGDSSSGPGGDSSSGGGSSSGPGSDSSEFDFASISSDSISLTAFDDNTGNSNSGGTIEFVTSSIVNSFSGVANYSNTTQSAGTTQPTTSAEDTTADPTATEEPTTTEDPTATDAPATTETPSETVENDANGDGVFDINDVTAVQKHLADLITLTDAQLSAADSNGDGKVNIKDATAMMKILVGYTA